MPEFIHQAAQVLIFESVLVFIPEASSVYIFQDTPDFTFKSAPVFIPVNAPLFTPVSTQYCSGTSGSRNPEKNSKLIIADGQTLASKRHNLDENKSMETF